MPLYTGVGDRGTTALFDGTTVPKDDARVAVYGDVGAGGHRPEAEHQGLRKRPRLRAAIADLADAHPDFLEYLARNRVLEGLPGFHDPRHRRTPARCPVAPARKQATSAVDDERDHRRVGPGEVFAPAGRIGAAPHVAAASRARGLAAGAAESVGAVPVHERTRIGEHRGVRVAKIRDDFTEPEQRHPAGERWRGIGHIDREVRDILLQAEKDRFARKRTCDVACAEVAGPPGSGIGVADRMPARCNGDEARRRGLNPFVEPSRILAAYRDPIHGVIGVVNDSLRHGNLR